MPMVYSPRKSKPGRIRELDYKKAFEYWVEYGTLKKATMALEREGIRRTLSDGTKTSFSLPTIRRAAWIWVIENSDEALEMWQEHGFFSDGKTEEWKEWMDSKILGLAQTMEHITEMRRKVGILEWANAKKEMSSESKS